MMRPRMRPALAVAFALLAGCSRSERPAEGALPSSQGAPRAAFDPAHPETSLALTADEASSRLGSFDWAGGVEWSVTSPQARLHVTEQHQLRQLSTGAFRVRADVDPGTGSSAVQGKEIVYAGGMTYARALPAPFRQRPTDRGRDARRFREDSFGVLRSVTELIGPALRIEANGGGTVLGREALRYRFALGEPTARPAAPAPAGFQAEDPDTALRQGFLRGAVPSSVEGELALDAGTGAPLQARLSAVFQGGPNGAAVSVVVSTQVKAIGGEVKAVEAPSDALPDERKPAGPSTALEAAGLKKRGEPENTPADAAEED